MSSTRKNVYLALLVAMGLGLSLLEALIPSPVIPGARLGLSNIVTLTALVLYGLEAALKISVLKSLLLVLLTGNVIALLYSLPAGIISTLAMGLAYRKFSLARPIFSLIGVSILGAVFHNFTQVTVASLILENFRIYMYLSFLLVMSLFTGYFVGLVSIFVSEKLKNKL